MKESDPKNSEDLDAGWDTSDGLDAGWDAGKHGASSVSAKQTKAVVPAVVDEIDAGWEADAPAVPLSRPAPRVAPVPKIQLSLSRLDGPAPASEKASPSPAAAPKQKDATKKPSPIATRVVAAPVAAPAVAVIQPTRKLSKKERRDLERQQRAYSAKKQAEIKRKRKEQRRAAASLHEPQPLSVVVETPAASAKSQVAAKAKSRRNSRARRAERPVTGSEQQATQLAPRAARRSNTQVQSHLTTRVTPSDLPERTGESKTNQRRMALWTLGIVIVVLALLFILQKR